MELRDPRAPNVLLVYPRFAAATFWNFAATCELLGVKYPAAPLGLITTAAMFRRPGPSGLSIATPKS